MLGLEPGGAERLELLLDGKEAQLVALAEVLDAVGRADEVLKLEARDRPFTLGDVDPRNLQLRLVDEDGADVPEGENVVYVGDGYSDRCAAQAANRIFARDGLAAYLDEQGVAYERYDDFFDIAKAL